MTTQLAIALGHHVAIDTSENRLDIAGSFGVHATINPKTDNVVDAIKEFTHGLGANSAIDASGSPVARVQAIQSVRIWDKVCYVGEGKNVTFDLSNDLNRRQITMMD